MLYLKTDTYGLDEKYLVCPASTRPEQQFRLRDIFPDFHIARDSEVVTGHRAHVVVFTFRPSADVLEHWHARLRPNGRIEIIAEHQTP